MININIPKEKEEQIYNASLDEFAKNGYTNASTNNITKNLDISKGTLFNYVKNKRNLYLFVLDKALEILEKEIIYSNIKLSPDIFERLTDVLEIKLKVFETYPKECKLVTDFSKDEVENFSREILLYYEKYNKISQEYLMKDIDMSKFNDNTDINKVYILIISISEYISNSILKQHENFVEEAISRKEIIKNEVDSYLNMIKYGVYK